MTTDSILFLFLVVAAYFFPWFVGCLRGHRRAGGLFLLNLVLGWTLVGWVVSFVWACAGPTHDETSQGMPPRGSEKICPSCAETVKVAANVCRFCGHHFDSVIGR